MDNLVTKYILTPAFALIGIFIAGTILDGAFGLHGSAVGILAILGGLYFVARFFKN